MIANIRNKNVYEKIDDEINIEKVLNKISNNGDLCLNNSDSSCGAIRIYSSSGSKINWKKDPNIIWKWDNINEVAIINIIDRYMRFELDINNNNIIDFPIRVGKIKGRYKLTIYSEDEWYHSMDSETIVKLIESFFPDYANNFILIISLNILKEKIDDPEIILDAIKVSKCTALIDLDYLFRNLPKWCQEKIERHPESIPLSLLKNWHRILEI